MMFVVIEKGFYDGISNIILGIVKFVPVHWWIILW